MQMYHVCDHGNVYESVLDKSERDLQNGDSIDRTDKRQFLFTEKSFRTLPWCMSCHRSAFGCLTYRTLYAETSFLDLYLSISDGFVKIYDKRDDFDIVNFPFLDKDNPRSTSYAVYISQLIRFARVSSYVDDFNTRNKVLTANFLR